MSDEFDDLFRDLDDQEAESSSATSSSGVRITGATPASVDLLADWKFDEPTTVIPAVGGEVATPEVPAVPPSPNPTSSELPHWTENPTGQVPAVLARDEEGADDPWAQVTSPTWREDESDWEAEAERFDATLLSSTEEPLGALNPEPVLEESQPWEFDIADQAPASEPPRVADPLDEATELLAGAAVIGAATSDEPPVETVLPRRRRGGSGDDDRASRRRDRGGRAARGGTTEVIDHDGGAGGRNLPVAIATGVIIAILVLVTFDIGTVLAMMLVIVVVTLAAAEAYAAFRRGGEHPATLLGLVAVASLTIATYNRGTQALGLVAVLLFAFTIVWFMAGVERANILKGLSSTMLVFAWVGVFGSYAALLLNPNLFPNRHGLAFLLGAILTSIAYDIAALFVGRSFGRRPLVPSISPHKTVEGLIGGSAASILVGLIIVPLIHPWTFTSGLTLGIVVAIVAPLGDLAESLLKRNLGIKDMGRLLPGHGGMLDRVDGLLFVLPATYYLVRAFHLG